jgi:hypothetical protein
MAEHRSADQGRPPDAGATRTTEDERPPVLGSWPRLYALVIAELIAIIILCGWLAGLGR